MACTECGLEKVKARNLCKKHYELWLANNTERACTKTNYPSDPEMVALAGKFSSMTDMASHLGIRRESLRDYLKIRPDLDAAVREKFKSNKVGPVESRNRWRAKNPEKVREINRRWAKNQDPAKRAKWNHYNRERRKNLDAAIMNEDDLYFIEVIRKDPCSYCGTFGTPTVDHVIPVEKDGTSEWENFAGACQSCNSSKNDDLLLLFMLRKAAEADTLKSK